MGFPSLDVCIHRNHRQVHALGLKVQISTNVLCVCCAAEYSQKKPEPGKNKLRLKALVEWDGEVREQSHGNI